MFRSRILLLFLLIVNSLYSQRLADITYDIEVRLDDQSHVLHGVLGLSFTNDTGRNLDSICILLYPNAYSTDRSAFAMQRRAFGYTDFHFASPSERGAIDSLHFSDGTDELVFAIDGDAPDIGWVKLQKPLSNGASISLTTTFRVRVPESFSRLGRVGESYQVTQWYPKLAMYDEDGWHPIPYLDSGEFYSEFGTYKVSIELPENYVVGATGTLVTQTEEQWLDSLARVQNEPTSSFPPSSSTTKTIVYEAEQVHDFAWFADKRFAVRLDSVVLSTRTTRVYALYTAASASVWDSATLFLSDALRFMDRVVGPYPYEHMTAVESPLSGGSGMEYPMITLIGYESSGFSLDRVLFHEVTHNWFQGMIATNERANAWMDEGLTSYYEDRYILAKYGSLRDDFLLHLTKRPNSYRDPQAVMQYLSRSDRLQAPAEASDQYAEFNHLFGAYIKPALAFTMLEEYLGRNEFDLAVQEYFENWRFRHPQPDDLRQSFEQSTGKDLGWLFAGLLGTKYLVDYSFGRYDYDNRTIEIRQSGQLDVPIEILGLNGSDTVFRKWYDVIDRDTVLSLDIDNCDKLLLFDPRYSLDEDPSNNLLYVRKGRSNKRQLKVTMFSGVREPGYAMINIFPFAGWNNYDKTMLGFNISNYYWPASNLEYSLTPLYSTGTGSVTGVADVKYKWFVRSHNRSGLNMIEFKFNFRTFHFNSDVDYNFDDRYLKYAPSVTLNFSPSRVTQTIKHKLEYRFVKIDQYFGVGLDFDAGIWERRHRGYSIHEVAYTFEKNSTLMPFRATVTGHASARFMRISAEVVQQIKYNTAGKSVFIRGFLGWLPENSNRDVLADFSLSGTADFGVFARDYMYDQYLFGRTELEGVLGQQVYLRDAGFNNASIAGLSDQWMAGLGLGVDVPGPVPLQLYARSALGNAEDEIQFSFTAGFALYALRDVLELYVPLYENNTVTDDAFYRDRSFFQRVTLLINFNELTPGKLRDNWLSY